MISNWTAAPVGNYVHVETADLYRPNARFTTETQGYQVLTPFGKLGYSHIRYLHPLGNSDIASYSTGTRSSSSWRQLSTTLIVGVITTSFIIKKRPSGATSQSRLPRNRK